VEKPRFFSNFPEAACGKIPILTQEGHNDCGREPSWWRNTNAAEKPHFVWHMYPSSPAAYPKEFSKADVKAMRSESRTYFPERG
jgi:hypothetical protein